MERVIAFTYAKEGDRILILLCGGDKGSQNNRFESRKPYRMLSENGNPGFKSLGCLLAAMGLELAIRQSGSEDPSGLFES